MVLLTCVYTAHSKDMM